MPDVFLPCLNKDDDDDDDNHPSTTGKEESIKLDSTCACPSLAGDIALCSWQDTLLSQCLSPPRCINEYW